MKGNKKIKNLASILIFVMLFQYISIIIPFLKVNADDEIVWSYGLYDYSTESVDAYVSGTLGQTITMPQKHTYSGR